jgi:hypothetical protein
LFLAVSPLKTTPATLIPNDCYQKFYHLKLTKDVSLVLLEWDGRQITLAPGAVKQELHAGK